MLADTTQAGPHRGPGQPATAAPPGPARPRKKRPPPAMRNTKTLAGAPVSPQKTLPGAGLADPETTFLCDFLVQVRVPGPKISWGLRPSTPLCLRRPAAAPALSRCFLIAFSAAQSVILQPLTLSVPGSSPSQSHFFVDLGSRFGIRDDNSGV